MSGRARPSCSFPAMPTIKVPPVLRPQTDGEAEVSVGGGTVGEALRALAERYPQTKDQLFSSEGDPNRYVNVYLNDEDVRVLDGLDTGASDSDTVVILPAMAGGAEATSTPSWAKNSAIRTVRMNRTAYGWPPVRAVKALQAGFGTRFCVNSPVLSNQMPPGRSRHEYQTTPAIRRRRRLAASKPNDFRR